jgi:hypothetical protein
VIDLRWLAVVGLVGVWLGLGSSRWARKILYIHGRGVGAGCHWVSQGLNYSSWWDARNPVILRFEKRLTVANH